MADMIPIGRGVVRKMNETVYDPDFFKSQQEGSRKSACEVVPILMGLINPESVIDIGCGTGAWLSVFKDLGVREILGVDGDYVNEDMLQIPKENFRKHDLTAFFSSGKQYDLVVSLEVGEHLPHASAETYVNTLVSHGDAVLFSAAIPYQGGKNHINEQWPGYWAELFNKKGFVAVDCIRKQVWENARVQWWYAQNTLLYVREEALSHYASLKDYPPSESDPLSLVHPRLYLHLAKDFFGDDGYKDGYIIGKKFTPRI
ncbi:class I SAM-dependent methyltransferase [Paenibacillus chitinolyticus]|uniref:class I SAM-dependent methyltransferase n=1 Tax=Paenibacillus chitinolyticus TaxID=79263 RepID=UPI0036593AC3